MSIKKPEFYLELLHGWTDVDIIVHTDEYMCIPNIKPILLLDLNVSKHKIQENNSRHNTACDNNRYL